MDRTFALEILPILGIVLIVLVLLLREVASGTFFSSLGNTSLPLGGYRYYIGEHTLLYIKRYGGCYRIYLLEGEPLGLPLHRTRAGEYFTLRANSPAEVEMEIVQIYRNQRGKEK